MMNIHTHYQDVNTRVIGIPKQLQNMAKPTKMIAEGTKHVNLNSNNFQ